MPALATVNDFECNDWRCKNVAPQFHSYYGTEERSGVSVLERFKRGLVCNIHAGGIKRRWQSRYNTRNNETLTLITDLPSAWDIAKAEYLAERKAAREAAIARQNEQARQNQLEHEARFAQAWVERSLETEPEITHGTDRQSYADRYRDGFTVGRDSWRGTTVLVEQDGKSPAHVSVTSSGKWSPSVARAIAKALLMAADLADIRDVTNGPSGE